MTIVNPNFEDRGATVAGRDTLTAYVQSAAVYPVAPLGAGTTLTIAVDGGTAQTVTFAGGETTSAEVMHAINAQLTGGYATTGSVPTAWAGTDGPTGSIQITGGTANATLLFPTTLIEGDDGGFDSGVLAHLTVPGGLTATLAAGARDGGGGTTVLDLQKTAGAGALSVILPFPQMTGGRVYRVTGWARGLDGLAAEVLNGAVTLYQGTAASSEWASFDVTFIASAGRLLFGVEAGAASNQHVQFDDVAIYSVHQYGEPGPCVSAANQGQGGAARFNDPENWASNYDDSGSGHLIAQEASGIEQFVAGWADVHLYMTALVALTSHEFNAASPFYAGVIESFEIWDGANWMDAFVPTDPTETVPPTLWHSAWWKQFAASHLQLDFENFHDGWTTFAAAFGNPRQVGGRIAGDWHEPSDTPGVNTYEVGEANRRLRLVLIAGVVGASYELLLAPATYTPNQLKTELNTQLATALGGSAVPWEFDVETDGDLCRLSFGWDGVTDVAGVVYAGTFCDIDNTYYRKDFRFHSGFYNLGPGGTTSESVIPADVYTPLPAGWAASDRLLSDLWSGVLFTTETDPTLAAIECFDGVGAMLFDTALFSASYLEGFEIKGWPIGGIWRAAFGPGDLTDHVWFGAAVDEKFVDIQWPSELYP